MNTGLIGWPVAHSISPAMHNAAFAALGISGRYHAYEIPPNQLQSQLSSLANSEVIGLNVTIPHKQGILDLVTEHSSDVVEINATNTLILRNGQWRAENTDWRGFLGTLESEGVNVLPDHPCLILGSGGAAQAIAFALRQLGVAEIHFASRTPKLSNEIDYTQLLGEGYQIIVNCTPVGMFPESERSPWPEDLPFPSSAILYDTIYNPRETRLMTTARRAGARVIGGLGMLIEQARLSFELWTGQIPEYGIMEAAALGTLKQ
jgi:shikimate dehydrogenase